MGRDFRENKAFGAAHKLVLLVYKHTKSFPEDEKYGITSQIKRAAVSVAANIVEGLARAHLKEQIQFIYQALSSLVEVEYYIFLARDLQFIGAECCDELTMARKDTGRLLNGLLRSMRKETS